MGIKCGIVGLPNVGKSTLFNAITGAEQARRGNFPFCTIDPNTGQALVRDDRLGVIADLAKSVRVVDNVLALVDIAGLVKGASKGEGLGNRFLSAIREVDAVIHLVRCFDSEDIVHVADNVDPVDDLGTVDLELMLADLASVEGRLPSVSKRAKAGDKQAAALEPFLEEARALLADGLPIRKGSDELNAWARREQFLTSKPTLYVANVAETDVLGGNEHTAKLARAIAPAKPLLISAGMEADLLALDESDRAAYLADAGLESGLGRITAAGFGLLDLITFFTAGPKEARAWTLRRGKHAPDAAGAIHSDMQRGFIAADVISCDDYVACKGEAGARDAGRLRLEGRDYVVHDGDVMHFRFNV